ncbi:metallophosphoesterase [Thalassovita taeanensis]|uniref:Calcineurin-like phosphoesterase n=1 Tax=Thalassovita taeanensis TaxID=657014 RepID=A0A1H8ZEM5_9RHOB|nr:metallophosphoesterase [Thalassovita taeanensis]SEP62831.1 Calcineurin-like phosphoesterase [Thalassovita taeanensis]
MQNATAFSTPSAAQLLPPVFDENCDIPDLPRDVEPWSLQASHSATGDPKHMQKISACLEKARTHGGWHWPSKPVVFLSDTHADAEGFLRSLVAAGVICRSAAKNSDQAGFTLTAFGHSATVLVGGDCIDKGPSNLDMLDALADVIATGVDLHLLAGNHDLRLRLAVDALRGPRSPLTDHLFVRMGRKLLPALREVFDRYVTDADIAALPDETACAARLVPPADWAARFSQAAKGQLPAKVIRLEIKKLQQKSAQFDRQVAKTGLTTRELLAAALKCHDLFFTPGGPYAWFYDRMDVVTRIGSLLFVHAGLDDSMCALLSEGGPDLVNARYRAEAERASFAFYFGPLANLVRTKYRTSDCKLTSSGVDQLHRAGIHMIVQGHVNNHAGQRLLAKHGVLHLEGDVTLDRASRSLEGLPGIGAGATLIFPSGDVIGLSRDYPRAKHFAPERIAENWS